MDGRTASWRGLLLVGTLVVGCQHGARGTLTGRATVDGSVDSAGISLRLAGPMAAATSSAADGSFHFAGLKAGRYAVVASASGTLEGSLTAEAALDDGAFPPLLFHSIGGVAGRVTRGGAQTGNQGIVVTLAGTSSAVITDDSGAFAIARVMPGSYVVSASAAGFVTATALDVQVSRGSVTMVPKIDLSVAPSGQSVSTDLRGQAHLTGVADASGITVTLVGTSLSTVTAADGSFVFANPPEGDYALAFDSGAFHETVPSVLSLTGTDGYYVDGALYPMGAATLALPHGRRVQSGPVDLVVASPHGDFVFYRPRVLNPLGYGDAPLVKIAATGGDPVLLAAYAAPVSPLFSPDGTRMLYLARPSPGTDYEVYSAPLDGVTPRADLGTVSSSFNTMRYSPDGATVLVNSSTGLQLVPSLGGAGVHLTSAPVGTFFASPKGDEVLVQDRCSSYACAIDRIPLSGASPSPLAALAYSFVPSPAWDRVAFGDGNQLQVVDLHSNVTTAVGGNVNAPYVFTPDGARLLYFAANATDLHSLSLADGVDTTLALALSGTQGATLSPAGTLVYYSDAKWNLFRIPVGGGTAQPLGQSTYVFSPHGTWVAVVGPQDFASYSAPLSIGPAEGGALVPVAAAVIWSSVHFSADDRQIAYLADDGRLGDSGFVEVSPSDTVEVVRLAAGARQLHGFSPDGNHLLYQSATGVLVVPVGGGGATELLDHAYLPPFFANDGVAVAVETSAAPPFSFQNGLYLLSVP